MTALAVNRGECRWSVTFANPPANVVDPEMILELQVLVDELEHDPHATAVVSTARIPSTSSGPTT
jgi:enoyl-CoA hydratase/carnithine racemase